jgi:hypothetical protein
MDGRSIFIRPAEELYLYERLVLRKPPKETTYRYALQRFRERYGADFLAEVFERRPSVSVFEHYLQEYLEKDGRTEYAQWGYHFDFLNGSYTWNGEALRISSREAVFLYERAVLRLQGRHGVHRHTAGNVLCIMRKKFGRRFLYEMFPNEETDKDVAAVIKQRTTKPEAGPAYASTDGTKPGKLIEGDI